MLVSCGSDSHAPKQPVDPRAWKACWCTDLLARFGIEVVPDPDSTDVWCEGMDPLAAQPEPAKEKEEEAATATT